MKEKLRNDNKTRHDPVKERIALWEGRHDTSTEGAGEGRARPRECGGGEGRGKLAPQVAKETLKPMKDKQKNVSGPSHDSKIPTWAPGTPKTTRAFVGVKGNNAKEKEDKGKMNIIITNINNNKNKNNNNNNNNNNNIGITDVEFTGPCWPSEASGTVPAHDVPPPLPLELPPESFPPNLPAASERPKLPPKNFSPDLLSARPRPDLPQGTVPADQCFPDGRAPDLAANGCIPGDSVTKSETKENVVPFPGCVPEPDQNHRVSDMGRDKEEPLTRTSTTTASSTSPPLSRMSSRSSLCAEDLEDPSQSAMLLRDPGALRASTPVRNAAVKRFWHQQTLKLELDLKEEKISALKRELEDLTFTGKAEEEVAALKKAKHDLELRIKDQEEELDDLAGQVQMLEAAKVRLEMSIEQMRKEHRKELSQRDEELEEIRISAQKKVKALEAQLENEHEERTIVVREKHELERRVVDLQDRTLATVDDDYVHKLKKDLKRTKALLKDTQTMVEKAQNEGTNKVLLRQLKTQVEDAEFAKTAAIKARQSAESDLCELQSQYEEALRNKKDAEDKLARMTKEKSEVQTQLEESEEEVAEVMKKYKATVSQLSVDQITLSEQSQLIAELEHERNTLKERLAELSSKVEVLEGETANIHTQRRLEMKIKEMESKLELEQTTRQRLESQITRLKDQVERLTSECDTARLKESQAVDQSKKLNRQLREAKEDAASMQQRNTDAINKRAEVEKQLEISESEVMTLKNDLKLAFKRIEDLQQAIQGDISDSDSDLSDSDSDSDTGSLSSYLTASLRHQRSSSNSTLRTPPSELQLDRFDAPLSPGSEGMSVISEDLEIATNNTKESFA